MIYESIVDYLNSSFYQYCFRDFGMLTKRWEFFVIDTYSPLNYSEDGHGLYVNILEVVIVHTKLYLCRDSSLNLQKQKILKFNAIGIGN